jgi:DNA repair/transcription protein MET18/MMS19
VDNNAIVLMPMRPPLQIFQPIDPLTEEEALKTTQVLVKTIYAGEGGESSAEIQGLARDACEECVQVLREPEKSQAKPAIKILCAFMSTTRPSVFHCFIHLLMSPHLVGSLYFSIYIITGRTTSHEAVSEPR